MPFKVVVDGEGGDFAPEEIIKGVSEYSCRVNQQIVVVASDKTAKKYSDKLDFIVSPDEPPTDESPTEAFRKKRYSSLFTCFDLLKDNRADAVVSAGNTGNLLIGSTLILGRLKNIERPALGVLLPTVSGGKNFIIDVGANPDIKPQHLTGLALLGQIFLEIYTGKKNLDITLLSNGVEAHKGNFFTKEAHNFLSKFPDFRGYIEGINLFSDPEKVILTDGFTGNIVIKSLEGLGEYIKYRLMEKDESILNKIKTNLGLFLIKSRLKKILKSMDHSEYGGTPLFGVNGLCLKAHGRAKAKSITRAIEVTFSLLENEYLSKVKTRLENLV